MRVAGDLSEVSLQNFLQIQAAGRRTCAVKVVGSSATGTIFLEHGKPVHATCGGLDGEGAVVALLAQPIGYFQVEYASLPPRRSLDGPLDRLMLNAHERLERGDIPIAPRPITPHIVPAPPASTEAGPRRISQAREGPAKRSTLPMVLSLVALGAVAVMGAAVFRQPAPGGESPSVGTPVDASQLTRPGDRPPSLRPIEAPRSPDPGFALQPTIVCRVLVAADGRVESASIYRSRVELQLFEEAALAAVRSYRFEPAFQGSKPVAAWINVPVRFQ